MKRLGDLLSGEGRSFGTWAQIPSPEVIDMIGLNGFDFVVVDCQHAPFGIETAERMARSAAATGLAAGVRVSRLDEVEILKALDAGLGHVVVPDIASAAGRGPGGRRHTLRAGRVAGGLPLRAVGRAFHPENW
jgi:2-keto-3-deoxy-L-rhamnonate aldolase RhmA